MKSKTKAIVPHLGKAGLFLLLSGAFMDALDFFIVNVTLPSLRSNLHASAAALLWIVAGYGLTYGCGLIASGKLGDHFGHRKMLGLGMALFTLSSAISGIAPTTSVLIAARLLQGVAAAMMTPQVLALISRLFSGEAQAKAFATFGATLGLAAVFGQLIGGLLIKWNVFGLGWRLCFLVNVPIGIISLLLMPRVLPEVEVTKSPQFDLGGVAIISTALVSIVLPLIDGRQQGWPAWCWACLAAALPLIGAFVLYEKRVTRRSGFPLIDMTLFNERAFSLGLIVQVLFNCGMGSFFLVLALYLQLARGLSALSSGVMFLSIGVSYVIVAGLSSKLSALLGKQLLALGALVMALGYGVMHMIVSSHTHHATALFALPLAIIGAGMGAVVAPLTSVVLERVSPTHAGAASGVLATAQQVGGALGVALIGIVFYTVFGRTMSYAAAFDRSIEFLIFLALGVAIALQFLPGKKSAAVAAPSAAAEFVA